MRLATPKFLKAVHGEGDNGGAVAPMPGVIEKISVQPGQNVEAGDPLVVMIAMKMEVSSLEFFPYVFKTSEHLSINSNVSV